MVNIAVAGCGYWGPNLVRNFASIEDCIVKKVCDLDPERLNHIRSIYPSVQITDSYQSLLADKDIDAIAIATPVRYHYEMANKSLAHGKHTFIEKPMASSAAQCQDLIKVAEENKLRLMVGHTFLYSTPIGKIKEIIDSGELGEILYINCRRLNLGLFQKDINATWDLAPHDISIILHIINQQPESVNCQGKAHINSEIEDITIITLNFSGSVLATIQSSWLDPKKVREITIVGDKKMLVYDDIEPNEKIKVYDKKVDVPPHYDTFAEFQYSYHYGDMHSPYLDLAEPLKIECKHFISCIQNNTKPLSGGKEGLRVVQILEAANKSLKNNGNRVMI